VGASATGTPDDRNTTAQVAHCGCPTSPTKTQVAVSDETLALNRSARSDPPMEEHGSPTRAPRSEATRCRLHPHGRWRCRDLGVKPDRL